MRTLLQVISWLACIGTIFPSVLFLLDMANLQQVQWLMLVATIAWFVATPLWMGRKPVG